MGKDLSEMTLEELWELFPIVLTKHPDCWAEWYDEERRGIAEFFCDEPFRIHHIGSTAIHAIWAKPIIDILDGKNMSMTGMGIRMPKAHL